MAPLKNPRHEKFVQAYLKGKNAGNATACYEEATGQKSKRARQHGYKVAKRSDVVARMDELRSQAEAKLQAEDENVARRLGITQEWVLGRLKDDVGAAEKIGQYGVAVKALELLGRSIGMFISQGDTINNVLQIGVQLIDRPPDETYEQWIARRRRELTHKTIEHHTNGTNGHAKNGNGQGH